MYVNVYISSLFLYIHIIIYSAGLTESEAQWQACDSPCILCHNDPQPLNFVRTPDGMEVYMLLIQYMWYMYMLSFCCVVLPCLSF